MVTLIFQLLKLEASDVQRQTQNDEHCKKNLRFLCSLLVGLQCGIFSGPSFADTNHAHLAVSLAIIDSNAAVNAVRNFGASHYTWGAAEVSLSKAGYRSPRRIGAVNEIYWFTVPVSGKPTVIGVSVNSREIKYADQTIN